ncbi:hypothetical protein A4X09_0g2120 [Tilletia walkeri]|uniref:Uncharacterized protein n=1 Tax=Tilletia walkeri TaxID=117179 RepID=A0A8X7NAD8_9BASI|nr:hypothetical protein A4X09_0g2120 [Tilletia walkeri]
MSLADELSGAFGGGGRSKRRAAARRQQQYLSDDDDDDDQQFDTAAPLAHEHDAHDSLGDSLGDELADLAGSSRRSKHSTAKSSAATAGHSNAGQSDAGDDQLDALEAEADLLDGHSAKSRGPSGGATYVQEADPLSDPSATPGSAEAQLDNTTEQTCSALSDVLSSTEAFLARLRKLTNTDSSSSANTGLPSSTTVTNLSSNTAPTAGSADDTARLEGYAAALLRSLRETAAQREQQVRDLREVDRHMARAEATDPDFLAKLAEADERLDAEADEADEEGAHQLGDESTDSVEVGQTQTWGGGSGTRLRRRQDSTASTETEKPPPQVVPRISSEPFSSEVTTTLASMLQRSATDIDVEEGGDGMAQDDGEASDNEGAYNQSFSGDVGDRSEDLLEEGAGEDELGPGWDDPTYHGANRRGGNRGGRETSSSSTAGVGDVSLASVSAGNKTTPSTLPSLRTSSTLLIHSLSSLHETAQVHRATISSAERRLRGLRLLLDGWKEEIVAARRSRAWIAKWEGRDPEKDDLLMDDGSGKVDDVLAASLAVGSFGSASGGGGGGSGSGSGTDSGRYTAGSGITPGAYAREQMSRFQRLLGEAEERAQALLTPLPLPRINPAAA